MRYTLLTRGFTKEFFTFLTGHVIGGHGDRRMTDIKFKLQYPVFLPY